MQPENFHGKRFPWRLYGIHLPSRRSVCATLTRSEETSVEESHESIAMTVSRVFLGRIAAVARCGLLLQTE